MHAKRRHMVTQVEIANKITHKNRSGKKTANEKEGANKTSKLVKWGRGK
jgi:hypothetical protein